MRTSVRTIMKARAQQRKSSLAVQGFKCHEIEVKRTENEEKQKYEDSKLRLEKLALVEELTLADKSEVKKLTAYIKEYKDKHTWKKPEEIKEPGFMNKVRSLFNRRK